MKLAPLAAVAVATLCGPVNAISFTDFVSQADLTAGLSNSATIGFAYAGNKFVGSVYFGPNNNQLYTTNLSGGGLALFGAPIPGFSGEIYLSSSLGIGGFSGRDIFAGSEASNTVYRISNDGTTQGTFVPIGITGGVRSIAFDPYGLYGNRMVVATNAGNVYTVDSSGAPTVLASVGEDAEGTGFAPQDFGPYAKGTLFVASEGSGAIRAIAPNGAVSFVTSISGAEMLSFVPLNLGGSGNPVEGFYAAAYPIKVVKADASEFVPYKGDIVVTDEGGHGVYDVRWNGASFVTTFLGSFPAQPEDGVFVTLDIIVPEPSTISLLAVGVGALLGRRRLRVRDEP
jgi:hypothetical protein